MIKLIKKSFIILLLFTMKIIAYIIKKIQEFYTKNDTTIRRYVNSIKTVLKEELVK